MLTTNQPPLLAVTQTNWTREALSAAIQTHIANVVGHYAGACYSWDVVNEALSDGNGTLRDSVFSRTLGTDFIPLSFQAAAAADPAARLYYNDFSLEFGGSKTDAALDIVRLVQNSTAAFPGARIDGVGFQAHMTVGGTPSAAQLAAVFERFVALGVEVAVTELDVRATTTTTTATNATTAPPAADADAVREQQARDYMAVVGACLAVPRCVGLVVWQFTDRYSWVPSTFPGAGEACLYDADLNKKPAWTSLASQLAAAATAAACAADEGTRPAGGGAANASGPAAPTTAATAAVLANDNGAAVVPTGAAMPALPAGAAPTSDVTGDSVTAQVAGSERVVSCVGSAIVAVVCSVSMLMFA